MGAHGALNKPCFLCTLTFLVTLFVLSSASSAQPRPGVAPKDEWNCPASHPIKGNLTTRTGECIYHVPGGAFYGKTKPELCFATEEEARRAGCRRSRR